MDYEKIVNVLDNQTTLPSKLRTKHWVEINDQQNRTYGTDSKIKFKAMMLKSIEMLKSNV